MFSFVQACLGLGGEQAIDAGLDAVASGRLSKQENEDLWKIYDRDKNGTLERVEVRAFVKDYIDSCLKKTRKTVSDIMECATEEATLRAVFEFFDANGDQQIQRAEFLAKALKERPEEEEDLPCLKLKQLGIVVRISLLSRYKELKYAEAMTIWERYDTQKHGFIQKQGLKDLMQDLVNVKIDGLKNRVRELSTLAENIEVAVEQLYQTLGADPKGSISREKFMEKMMEGYDLQEPARKRQKTGWAEGQSFKIGKEKELWKDKEIHTFNSIKYALEQIQGGIVPAHEGIAVVYESTSEMHYVFFREDKKRAALQAFGRVHWDLYNAILLENKLSDSNKRFLVEGVKSVTEAIDALNMGLVKCDDNYCVVFSASRQAHFIVYREGYEDEAKQRFAK